MELQICGSALGIICGGLGSVHLDDYIQNCIRLEIYMEINMGWRYSSVTEHVLRMNAVLGLIPSTKIKWINNKTEKVKAKVLYAS